MELKKYNKRIAIITTLSLCSIMTFNILNNFMSKSQNETFNNTKLSQTSIISDINNMDISLANNNFILKNNVINWKLRHYTTLWNNGGQKTLEYINAFNIDKDLNFKIDEDLIIKLINKINKNLNDFGKNISEQTDYIKSDKFFANERTELDKKFNFISGASHVLNCNWKGYFDWRIYLLASFKQMELTQNQIGGQYLMDYKFESNLLNDVESFHIYDQGFDWKYFSGFDYTISLEKNQNNIKESEVFKSDFMLDIFSSKNSENIVRTFLDINLPYLEKNPNNKSGIWNKEDLIKNDYESIFKFSDDLKLLKMVNEYNKSNNDKNFSNNMDLMDLQKRLKKNNIIKSDNEYRYSINELSLLYERIIGWFKNNNIIANISIDELEGKDYVIWNGNSFLDEYDFFNTNSNKNTLSIKINHIESKLKNYDSKVISGNSKTNDVFGEYLINYRNDFFENEINIKESFNKCIPIEIDFNVEDIIIHNGSNVSFVNNVNNDLPILISKSLNNKMEQNLFKNVELFDYLEHDFCNTDEVLKSFEIYENRNTINHSPNNYDGIFYVIGIIPKWNTIDTINNYNGNFNLEDKKNFIKNINKNGTNIEELFSNNEKDTNGYFLLKLRTGKTNYLKNLDDYENILNNFNKLFKVNYIEKNHNDFFTNIKNKEFKDIEILDETEINEITHEKINEEFKEKEIWTKIKNSPNDLFNYLDLIFDESNLKYKDEINDSVIKNKINEIKLEIISNENSTKSLNILNIVFLSLSILFTLGLSGLIFYKFKKNKSKNAQKNYIMKEMT